MKRPFWLKKYIFKRDMTSVNLGKALEYLKIQGSLQSENLIYVKKYFCMFFSISKEIIQEQN